MPVVFPRIDFVGFRINVISGFNTIASLPAGINLVLSQDFNDQKRLILAVFEFSHTISVFVPFFDSFCFIQN